MRTTRTNGIRVALGGVAVSAFAAAFVTAPQMPILVGVVTSLLCATSFGGAGRVAAGAEALRGRPVTLTVWGRESTPGAALARVESVLALGAGLHFWFRTAGGATVHLKIAQPWAETVSPEAVIIKNAKYVQLSGRRLPRAEGHPAVELLFLEEKQSPTQREDAVGDLKTVMGLGRVELSTSRLSGQLRASDWRRFC